MQTKIRGNSQIIAGTITNAEISPTAAIALTKLAEAVIQADGGQAFTADQSMGGFKLTNLATPVAGTDAATKDYVDALNAGLDPKASVRAATTANITLSGTQTIDGVSLSAGNRVLVKDQSTGSENGIYVVASGAWSRSTDADSSAEVNAGMFLFVEEGTTNGDSGWLLTTNNPITLGTTALAFSRFSAGTDITAGVGLSKSGNTLDFNSGEGLEHDGADNIRVKLDGATLARAAAGIKVADGGITATQLATSVAGNGLAGGGGTALSVNTDGNALYINSDSVTLRLDGASLQASGSGLKVNPAKFIVRETPSGTINGTNTDFTLANTPITGKEEVFLNGLLQEPGGEDYTLSGTTVSFASAPVSGDRIRVSYLIG